MFAIYLTHAQVIHFFYASNHSNYYESDYSIIMLYVAAVGWSCVFSLLVASFVKFPFLNLIKFIFKLCGIERRRQVAEGKPNTTKKKN